MPNIDDLSIQIVAESNNAINALSALQRKLSEVASGITKVSQSSAQAMNAANSKQNNSSAQKQASNTTKNIKKQFGIAKLAADAFQTKLNSIKVPDVAENNLKKLTNQMNKSRDRLDALNRKMQEFRDFNGDTNSSSFRKMQIDAKKLELTIDKIGAKIRDNFNGQNQFFPNNNNVWTQPPNYSDGTATNGRELFAEMFPNAAQAFGDITSRAGEFISVFKAMGDTIKGVADKFLSFVKQIGGIGKSIASAISRIKSLAKSTGLFGKQHDMTFKKAMMTVLRYGFGIRGLFVLFNRLRNAIKDGFSNLARYSDETNKSISKLSSALGTLKNSSAAALNPLLNMFASQIATILNLATRALNAVGALMSALTGKAMTVQAVGYASDYAASLEKGAKSSKKIKDNLLGIDELNIIHPDDESGSGGGGGGVDPNKMFETIETPEWAKNLADMLKKAWEEANFYPIGRLIGDKLRDSLNAVLWETKIRPMAKKVAQCIGTLINGFVETEGLGSSIGMTVGEAINTAVDFVNTFFDTTQWESVGDMIAEGINTAIDTIDWSELGRSFTQKFSAIFQTLSSTLGGIKWSDLGASIGEMVDGAISGIDWNSALTSAQEFGTGIATALKQFITPERLMSVGETLANALNVAIEAIYSFVESADFSTWVESISGAINTFFHNADWEKLNDAVGALFDALIDFLNKIDWDFIGQEIHDLIAAVDFTGLWIQMKAIGAQLITEIVSGVTESIARSVLGDTVVDWLKKIGKENGEIKTSGKEMVTEYNSGMTMESGKTKDVVSGLVKTASEAFKNPTNGESLQKAAKESISDMGSTVASEIQAQIPVSTQAVQSYTSALNETFQNEGNFMAGATEGMQGSWEEFMAWWDETLSAWISGNEENYFGDTIWYKISNGMKSGIEKKWKEFETSWSKNMKTWFSTWVEPFFSEKQWGDFGNNMAEGITKGFSAIVAKVGTVANGIVDVFNSVGESVKNSMNTLIQSYNSMAGVLGATSVSQLTFTRANRASIPKFSNGGFPTSASLFWAGENGMPEIVGQMNGRTAVASGDEITGIRQAVYDSSQAESQLLQMAIGILQQIADKDISIGDEDIAKASIRGSRSIGLQLRTI